MIFLFVFSKFRENYYYNWKALIFLLTVSKFSTHRSPLASHRSHGSVIALDFNQDGEDLAKKREKVLKKTKLLLEIAQKCYEKQINTGIRKMEYEVGQKVLLNVKNFTISKGLTPKFMSKFAGLFPIVERVFKDMCKLELPPEIKVHPTFHVSLLKPFEEDTLSLNRK